MWLSTTSDACEVITSGHYAGNVGRLMATEVLAHEQTENSNSSAALKRCPSSSHIVQNLNLLMINTQLICCCQCGRDGLICGCWDM